MDGIKRIGLVAHDSQKKELLSWVQHNENRLRPHAFWATGTTARILAQETGLAITGLKSGPLGGDQQLGAMIAEGKLDMLVFFSDPMTAMPHDVDVKALVRLCGVYNIVLACNRTSADFMISSPHFDRPYKPVEPDHETYRQRVISA